MEHPVMYENCCATFNRTALESRLHWSHFALGWIGLQTRTVWAEPRSPAPLFGAVPQKDAVEYA
jgi:hypothetical protein